MDDEIQVPPLAGQPMSITELLDEMALLAIPEGCKVVTIEEARKELPIANDFITNECNKLSIDAGELLHTSGHFGNPKTKINLNKKWSELFE